MLERELAGEEYVKSHANRELNRLLPTRTLRAIESKHQNISAILIEERRAYIPGYKPLHNYQRLLRDEVIGRLRADRSLDDRMQAWAAIAYPRLDVEAAATDVFVPPPTSGKRPGRIYERREPVRALFDVDYLEREAQNASLGAAGEAFIMDVEHRRLWEAGARDLAGRIEHVANTKGDGLGFDILSYELSGLERLIEVKTTRLGAQTPFYASAREVHVSDTKAETYQLYRVFGFGRAPKVFVLAGSLRTRCALDAIQYRASIL
jgi:hypothetical protein